ncbi:MAG: glycerol-3-phosphate acyltransferase [Bacteroidales bacterium]|jgi:glycerol-3-phosphate acyltransferase PlsY|nr:glycerol-3-phosphate acyltransferase [Bacteroidales bacterium]
MSRIVIIPLSDPAVIIPFCLISGYLIGSFSFARLVLRVVTGERNVKPFSEHVPHSDETFESDLVSATLVTKQTGAKYGCITSVADMAKVALPALALNLLLPGHPYYLLFALCGVLGHNYPLYYRFRGGRGESPILGILLVINWYGLLAANLVSIILGFITGSVLVVRWGAYVLLVFWLPYHFGDIRYGVFMVLINILFFLSMRKDLTRFNELKKKKGIEFSEEDVSEFILMGRSLGRALDRYSIYALLRKRGQKKQNPPA